MSTQDVERFIADLKADPSMRDALKGEAGSMNTVIAFAKKRGYDISREDVKSHLSALAGKELSDDQLDAIAGGATTTQTQTVATTEVVQINMQLAPMLATIQQLTVVVEAAVSVT